MTVNMTYTLGEVPPNRITEIAAFVQHIMGQLYPEGKYHKDPYDLAHFAKVYLEQPKASFYIAEDSEGRIIGTAAIRPYDDRFPSLQTQLAHHDVCEMTRLYIDEAYRRKGIGSQLYNRAEAFATEAGYTTSYLHTSSYLPGGLPFWTSRSYRELEWETDEIVHMAKALTRTP